MDNQLVTKNSTFHELATLARYSKDSIPACP